VIAGGTSNADVALQPGNTCTTGPDSGTTGPDGGAGGSSGHGSSPPSLAHCTEYGHDLDPAAACVTGDANTDVVITDVAFSHSGKTLYTAGVDSRVKVWVWDEATLSLTAEGHELDTSAGFSYVAVSPDDKLVAVGSTGGRLTIWNVGGTWSIAGNLTGITGDIYGVAFSPDSKTLYAIDTDGNLTSYVGTVSPTVVTLLNPVSVPFVLDASTIESDGSFWLGVGYSDGDASLLHVVGGNVGPEFPFTVSTGLSGTYTMRFSADGTLVESGTDDGSFGIWSVPLPTPANPRSPPIAITTDWIYGAAFHPTGASIAIAAGGSDANRQLGIWTLATGAPMSAVSNSALSYRPTAVAFSPDGTTLVAGEHSCGKLIVCAD
jgi:WD40 repeat protein